MKAVVIQSPRSIQHNIEGKRREMEKVMGKKQYSNHAFCHV